MMDDKNKTTDSKEIVVDEATVNEEMKAELFTSGKGEDE